MEKEEQKKRILNMHRKYQVLQFCILLLSITQTVTAQSQSLSIKEVFQKVQTNLP
jgi:hypothetical protein